LLETLAAAAADALNAELPVKRVRVSVRKPGVAWAEWAGVTCERP
jgi:dihydroneopterin aldolase